MITPCPSHFTHTWPNSLFCFPGLVLCHNKLAYIILYSSDTIYHTTGRVLPVTHQKFREKARNMCHEPTQRGELSLQDRNQQCQSTDCVLRYCSGSLFSEYYYFTCCYWGNVVLQACFQGTPKNRAIIIWKIVSAPDFISRDSITQNRVEEQILTVCLSDNLNFQKECNWDFSL